MIIWTPPVSVRYRSRQRLDWISIISITSITGNISIVSCWIRNNLVINRLWINNKKIVEISMKWSISLNDYQVSLVYRSIWNIICIIYNMSGRVVWDIQNRAEGERLYVRYNTAANIVTEVYYIQYILSLIYLYILSLIYFLYPDFIALLLFIEFVYT